MMAALPPRVITLTGLRRFDGSEHVPARAPLRTELGIRSFGANAFFADAGAVAIEEHDELGSAAGRHEELYVVVCGAATFTLDGDRHDAPAGTLVFVPEPSTRRGASATADGTVILVIGAAPGQVFRPSAWEASADALEALAGGDLERAVRLQRAVLADYPDSPDVLYNLACIESRAGYPDDALRHLAVAARRRPDVAGWAGNDTDLDAIRDRPGFSDALAGSLPASPDDAT
jgi:Tetratricopeptide repeat